MDELCPLCLKMGSNRRIKAVQINLEEAVWMCENEECPWPFGHEKPNFLSRRVGDGWSDGWEVYKKVQKRIGPIPVSTELSLYTPPVTPSGDAATKESGKSDFSNETNISEQISQIDKIFSGNSIPNDSYAPKTSPYDEYSSNEINEGGKEASSANVKRMPSQWSTDSSMVVRASSVLPSIFDIDGDEFLNNKISIKEPCPVTTRATDLSSPLSVVLDVRKIPTITDCPDTVLKTAGKPDIPLEKLVEETRDIIVTSAQRDNLTKGIPQIRSISRTNIDLQMMDSQRAVKIEKMDRQRVVDVVKMDHQRMVEVDDVNPRVVFEIEKMDCQRLVKVEKIYCERVVKIEKMDCQRVVKTETMDVPKKIETPLDGESVVSPMQRESLDDIQSHRQRTTTITLDGSLPITLSYDLTDLEEKSDKNVPATSTPICERSKRTSSENPRGKNLNERTNELPTELPKRIIRPPAKRRAATSIGKQYEKFSFSALKKFSPASKDCDDRTRSVIIGSNLPGTETVKFEEITSLKEEKSSVLDSRVDPPDKIAADGVPDLPSQLAESMSSVNIDPGNSGTTSDDHSAETLNLSGVLDDILMEGYQNATDNLNDDWLESFFTQDT